MDHAIIFGGTSHIDPDGYERTIRFLEEKDPEVILLEVSPFSLLFRKTLGRLYRVMAERRVRRMGAPATPELLNTLRCLEVPPEYMAARDHLRKQGGRLALLDVSLFSLLHLSVAHRVISRRNLGFLAGLTEDRFSREREIARRIFLAKDGVAAAMKLRPFGTDRLIKAREGMLIKRMRRKLRRFRGRRIVYIGGWEHLIDDYAGRTLYAAMTCGKERDVLFLDERI